MTAHTPRAGLTLSAEGVGFEPTRRLATPNGFQGIDQAKRVEVGPAYISQVNPYSEAPALEHAYAITTYSAQGSTVDRAFVAADPSMDKQELYVATSRSHEETHLYATPEIQVHRKEIAPRSVYLREGIPHIAEASERDRASARGT